MLRHLPTILLAGGLVLGGAACSDDGGAAAEPGAEPATGCQANTFVQEPDGAGPTTGRRALDAFPAPMGDDFTVESVEVVDDDCLLDLVVDVTNQGPPVVDANFGITAYDGDDFVGSGPFLHIASDGTWETGQTRTYTASTLEEHGPVDEVVVEVNSVELAEAGDGTVTTTSTTTPT